QWPSTSCASTPGLGRLGTKGKGMTSTAHEDQFLPHPDDVPQASAEAIRNAALEEAARLMESTGKRIAASDIRALKSASAIDAAIAQQRKDIIDHDPLEGTGDGGPHEARLLKQ